VWVVNDLKIKWRMFGDGNLDKADPDNRTREMCETAVRLGLDDVHQAAQMGAKKGATPMTPAQIFDSVRGLTATPAEPKGDKYGAEQVLPRLDPDAATANGTQNWKQSNVDALWGATVLGAKKGSQSTYGEEIEASMKKGELNKELTKMADKFPPSQDVKAVFTVHPKQGYLDGFLAPLVEDPQRGLLSIINFTPSKGQAFFNEDDAVMREINGEDGKGGMSEKQLEGMTLEQKADRVRALAGGFWNWCGEDEGDTVVRLFRAAGAGERRTLYEMVEGHKWEGDFRHGWLTIDDDLWDSLSSSQLTTLRDLING